MRHWLVAVVVALIACEVSETPAPAPAPSSAPTFDRVAPPGAEPSPADGPDRAAPSEPSAKAKPDPAADADAPTAEGEPALDASKLFEKPELMPRREPGITVVEAGAEPRLTHALPDRAGHEVAVPATLGMTLAVAIGTREVPPTDIPPVSMTLTASVTSASTEAVEVTITASDVVAKTEGVASDRVQTAITKAAEDLGGAKAIVTTTRGGPAVMQMEGGADLTRMRPSLDGLFDTLRGSFVPLPSDPIGPGAIWEAVSHREEAGAQMQLIARYELTSVEGETLKIKWTARRGVLSVEPTDGAGIEAHAAVGGGDLVFDLRAGAPTTASVEINSRTHARIKFGQNASPVMVHQLSRLELGAER